MASSKSLMTRRLPSNHDIIFLYSKSTVYTWNVEAVFSPYDLNNLDEKTARKYSQRDADDAPPKPFKFAKVVGALLNKEDWSFSGRSGESRRTITASVIRSGLAKMESNWIYRH